MTEQDTYTLAASSNTDGCYALNEPDGPEISSGQRLAIQIGALWIEGSVEHYSEKYVNRGLRFLGDKSPEERTIDGYYFIARGGGICGLCLGMKVRLL